MKIKINKENLKASFLYSIASFIYFLLIIIILTSASIAISAFTNTNNKVFTALTFNICTILLTIILTVLSAILSINTIKNKYHIVNKKQFIFYATGLFSLFNLIYCLISSKQLLTALIQIGYQAIVFYTTTKLLLHKNNQNK